VLRDEQAAALGAVDLLFIPVGGSATIGADQAAAIVEGLKPRWVIPMHYRTARIDFLDTADAFLQRMVHIQHLPASAFEIEAHSAENTPLVIVPAAP
jgi:L-ascorbate metabolism protein UlaG (beta-lactamase superfamily)